jgi:hypothetical protein
MTEIYRNKVVITAVHNARGRQFAFGVVQEPELRTVFFPFWIIKAFEITSLDKGCTFDCLFTDQAEDKHPVVIGILDENVVLQSSQLAGTHDGRPGTIDFTAVINLINRKPANV